MNKVRLYYVDILESWVLNMQGHKCAKDSLFSFPDKFHLDVNEFGEIAFFDENNEKADLVTMNKYPYILTPDDSILLKPALELDADAEIRKVREQVGMTKTEFSQELCIPIRTLEDWENGNRKPPIYVVKLLQFWADNQ